VNAYSETHLKNGGTVSLVPAYGFFLVPAYGFFLVPAYGFFLVPAYGFLRGIFSAVFCRIFWSDSCDYPA